MTSNPSRKSRNAISRRRVLQWSGVSAAAVAASSLGIACGDDSSDTSGTNGTASPAANASASQPKRGGKVAFAYSNIPQNLDVQRIVSPTLGEAATLVMNRLIRHDPKAGPTDYNVEADIAASWEQPDDLSFVFKLRPEVKWQEKEPYNGRPLVAKDVLLAYEREGAKDPAAIFAYLMTWIDSITAPDDHTIVIKAKEPNARALDYLAFYQSAIVPIECVDKFGSLENPESWVGTGAYHLTSWKPGVGFQLDRNPSYWEPDRPYIDHVDLNEITDLSAQLTAFLSGSLDVLEAVDAAVVPTVQQRADGARLVKSSEVGGVQYAWTVKDSPFKDPRVRKAWDLIIDRQSMLSSIAGDGNAEFRVSPVSPGFTRWARTQEQIKKDMVFDPAQAKALLEQAGQGSGFTAGILGNSEEEKAWISWALQQGKKAGITIDPQVVERTVYLTAQRQHKFNLGQIFAMRAYPDPDDYLFPVFVTGESKNYWDMSDPALDDLIKKQRQALDPEKRKQILQEIDSRWTTDFNYSTFGYTRNRTDAVSKRLGSYVPRPYDITGVKYAWVE